MRSASVGTGVVDRFKGLLGIHSPSRVFAQLGDFTMQGLTVGLQRGQGAPVQAVHGARQPDACGGSWPGLGDGHSPSGGDR
ncbi:hypothetical protein TP45_06830 [Xanthomonas citri pv. aurantifolii]|nr:hypothetical protein TP45_06830 [Xanthomonas citri pv. aurantifolii]